ncbi:MAG TPA: OmpH family outer membrane protein [Candidatus Aquilonibacter sp.]|nr:OmpH family outer membrane protein [Candidatus Aquilonibacter sp.]
MTVSSALRPPFRVAVASLALASAIITGGCSRVDVHSSTVRGVAYIRVDDVIKHHPLFPQVQQLETAMTAINLEATIPRAPLTPQEIAQQTQALNAQLKSAQDRANAALGQIREKYQAQERDADIAALKAAHIDPAAAGIGQAMSATSQQQLAQAAQTAQKNFAQYQQDVVAQDRAAMNSVAAQLSKEADQKIRARAEQYQQQETDLSLRVAQQDSSQRLALKTKMNNIAMDAAERKQVAQQLAALDKKEADAVNAMRSQHAKELGAYQDQVRKETNAKIQAQAASIQSQTQAKLSARQQEVGAQLRSLGAPPVPQQSLPPDVRKQLMDIHQQMAQKFQADAQATAEQFNTTKADLDAQFAALHGENVGATGAAAKQLRDLQKRHDDLLAQIQSQIQREAVKLAKDMGFTVVLDNVSAAPGGYDLTNDLIHDVEGLHE